MIRERGFELRHGGGERRGDVVAGERESVRGDQQALRRKGGAGWQHHVANTAHRLRIAREPADRVETRRQIGHAVDRHQAVRGADAVDAAIAGRQPHRAAAISAERKIDKAAGDRGRRSAGRAAGNAARRARIGRRAVMHILAIEAVSQFIGVGFSDHRGAGGEQALDGRRGARRRRDGSQATPDCHCRCDVRRCRTRP